MNLSYTETLSGIILVVAIVKAIWDLSLNDYIRQKRLADLRSEALRAKAKSHGKLNTLLTTVFTIALIVPAMLVLGETAMTKEVSRSEFLTLQQRVKKLEDKFGPPGGPGLSFEIGAIQKSISNVETSLKDILKKHDDDLDWMVRELPKMESDLESAKARLKLISPEGQRAKKGQPMTDQ